MSETSENHRDPLPGRGDEPKRRRRVLLRFGVALLLLAIGVGLGLLASTRLAPARLRLEVERALAPVFGDAQVAAVALHLRGRPRIEALGIELAEGDHTALSLRRAELGLRFDLENLRLRFDDLLVEGLRIRIERSANGAITPERVETLLRRPETKSDRATFAERLAPLDKAGLHTLRLRDSAIELRLRGRGTESAPQILRIEQVDLTRDPGSGVEIAAKIAVEDDAKNASLYAEGHVSESGDGEFALSVSALPLSLGDAWLDACCPGSAKASGRVEGSAAVRWASDPPWRVDDMDLVWSDGAVRTKKGTTPLPTIEAQGDLVIEDGRVRITLKNLAERDVALSGRVLWDPRGTVDAILESDAVAIDSLRRLAEDLGRTEWRDALSRVKKGRVGPIRIATGRQSVAALLRFLDDPRAHWPAPLRVEASVSRIEVDLEGDNDLHDLGARITTDAAQLDLRHVRARLGDRPLPELELRLRGWSEFLAEREMPPLTPVVPLPGRAALVKRLRSTKVPGSPPRWREASVELAWLDHPLLLWPLDQVLARLRPLDPGIAVVVDRAHFGGLWIKGDGVLSGEPESEHIALNLEVTDAPKDAEDAGKATPQRDGVHWALGRYRVALDKLGDFQASETRGSVSARGSTLVSNDAMVALVPRGEVLGRVSVNLDRQESVPYTAAFQLIDGDVSTIVSDLGGHGDLVSGDLVAGANLRGHLRAGEEIMLSIEGPISAHAREGELRSRVPLALAIASASDTFNPFRSRDTLPYDAVDGEFEFERGVLLVRNVSAKGPTLRMVGTGSVNLVDEKRPVEAVVGFFFFRGLDTVLGKLPILNTLILGSDENLVPAYFSLEGPAAKPKATLIPGKSLLAGPASVVVEGVPNFVLGGIERLGRLFSLRPAEDAKDPAAAEETDAETPSS